MSGARGKWLVALALPLLGGAGAAWWWWYGVSRPQTAEILSVQGDVRLDGQPLTQAGWTGQARGRDLAAGADGFVAIRLSDGSVTQVTPNSRLAITEARQSAQADKFRTDLKLDAGEVMRDVPAPSAGVQRESNLVTPAANVGVRGTYYLVRSDAGASRVMVHRGAVALGETALSENYGTVAQPAKPPEAPSVLLPPPELQQPGVGQRNEPANVDFRWAAVPQARGYLLELARDERFRDLLRRQRVPTAQISIDAPVPHDLPLYWRVASIDARDLVGRYSEPRLLHYKRFHAAGRFRIAQGDGKGAIEQYRLALVGYPREATLLADIGWAHYIAADLPRAREWLDQSVRIDDNDVESRIRRGRVLYWMKDLPAARADYEKALAMSPGDADALWGLGEVTLAEGDRAKALELLEQALAKVPAHEYALFSAAKVAFDLGKPDRARELLARELRARPQNEAAVDLYARLQRKVLPR